jgi:hypothetical protein
MHIRYAEETDADDDDDEPYGADYAKRTAVAAALSTLRAAAMANRTWYAAALPHLWWCPPRHALSDGAVAEPTRRAMYVSQIRELRVLWRDPLWQAVTQAVADADNKHRQGGSTCPGGSIVCAGGAGGGSSELGTRRLKAFSYGVGDLDRMHADQAARD